MKRLFSAPTTINLELTELCNVKCRHCYNFWRDDSMGSASLDKPHVDKLVARFKEAGIFHVVLTGGEPMSNFDILEYVLHALRDADISVSCNSNMMLVSDERIERLMSAGLDHILTSLPSCDPATNDYIMGQVGSFERIMRGIDIAVSHGMRISVNMVLTRKNKEDVYRTGKLVADKGCQKLFVTRAVPPTYSDTNRDDSYDLTPDEVRRALDDAVRVKEDFNIMIGSLVSYPLCFLGDLDKYRDFVGRGCPSQSGHRMSLNADGTAHTCVHEEESYGNAIDTPIKDIYQSKMRKWHDGSFYYKGCQGCDYMEVCQSGCSMMSLGVYGAHEEKDPLFVGPGSVHRHYQAVPSDEVFTALDRGARFMAPRRLRFRKEDGFYLMSIRWANIISLADDVAEFLIAHRDSGEPFTVDDFGRERRRLLAELFFKDAITSDDFTFEDTRDKAGLSINLEDLPVTV